MEQVIIDIFKSGGDTDIRQRVAAWALLHRLLDDKGRLVEVLSQVQTDDPLLSDLKAAAMELGVVPDSMETVTWLRIIRADSAYWAAARTAVEKLGPEQRHGLELRHLPVLVYAGDTMPQSLQTSREELISQITHAIGRQEHFLKGPTYDGPMDEHPQQFRQWREALSWGDLLVTDVMLQLIASDRLARAWFAHADKDRVDTTTEYGGLVRRDSKGEPYVHAYSPMIRRHDLKYIPPKEVVTDGYQALAHYHFHAQEHHNSRFAGPGIGDLERIARTQQFNGLVLTFVDENRLNVDLYFRPEVVIDLGTLRRP
jgi:hypothetical protein